MKRLTIFFACFASLVLNNMVFGQTEIVIVPSQSCIAATVTLNCVGSFSVATTENTTIVGLWNGNQKITEYCRYWGNPCNEETFEGSIPTDECENYYLDIQSQGGPNQNCGNSFVNLTNMLKDMGCATSCGSQRLEFNEVNNNALDVVLYPNPVQANLNIRLIEQVNSPIDIQIYDTLGKLVYSETKIPEGELIILSQDLGSGVYFINLRHNGKYISKKFVKQ